MFSIKGYTIIGTTERDSMFFFNKALRNADNLPVLIKSALIENTEASKLLKQEYEVTQLAENNWGIKPIALEYCDEGIALIFENFNGERLDNYIKKNPLELNKYLKIAGGITSSMAKMADKEAIYTDIKSSNVFVNPLTDELKIVDTGIASLLSEGTQTLPYHDMYSELELKEYKHFFVNTQDFACIANLQGYFEMINPNFEKILGYSEKELYGNQFLSFVHPDDIDKTIKEMAKLKTGAVTINVENRYRKKDGSYLWLDWNTTSNTTTGKLYAIARDITEKKHAEEEIHASEERFRRFAEINNEGVVIHDEGKIIEANPAFAKMFGYKETEVIGMHALQFTAPESIDVLKKNMAEKSIPPFEAVGLRKDGSTFYTELQGRRIDYKGKNRSITTILDITSRKKAENKLRESEEKFRLLVETTNIIPWETDVKTFQFTYIGPQAEKVFGYPTNNWYTTDFWPNHIHPDDRKQALDYCLESFKTKKEYEFEYRMIAANGTVVWLHDYVTVVQDQKGPVLLRGFFIDISTRKIAEEKVQKLNIELNQAIIELKESENKLKQAQKIASMGNWEWDIKKNIVTWSDELYRIFGTEPQDFTADYAGYLSFVHPNDINKVNSAIENALINKTSFEFDHGIIKRDGSERVIHSNGRLICDENNEPFKMYGIAHDITELKQAELEIKHLNAELEKRVVDRTAQLQTANKDLEKANIIAEQSKSAKQMFLASMSHEIRTPLNSIIGFQQLLKDTPLSHEQQEYVESIDFAGRNLLIIINDILDLSKIESGKFEFDETEINISDITKSVVTLVSSRAKEKNIKLFISQDLAIPSILYGDSARLSQILLNLIGNAVKFTETGEVKITTQLVEETEEHVLCEFLVEDTGIGIPENKLVTIFESFSQGSTSTTQKYGGTGLGLTISKHLVEMQGGTITVKSQVDIGSAFSFKLNFKKISKHNLMHNIIGQSTKPKNEPGKKLDILLAEDVHLNQRLVIKIMEKWGHHLDIADNGKIAIEKIKIKNYDLILMDIQMPEMDGYQATQYIRSMPDEAKQSIPIIALTAHASHAEAEKCLNLGMNAYIAKPFNQQQLQQTINQLTHTK